MDETTKDFFSIILEKVKELNGKGEENDIDLKENLSSLELVSLIVELEKYYDIVLQNLSFEKFTVNYLVQEIKRLLIDSEEYKSKIESIKKDLFD